MYKEVQRALRSFFIRFSAAAPQQQQAEWQLQQQPLGLRSAVRDSDVPPAVADGSFGSGSGDGSNTGSLALAEPASQVCTSSSLYQWAGEP